MIDKFKASFREETHELLGQLEATLLELESDPGNEELINAAFRAIHTVKGSSGMFGFDAISHFTHDIENALDKCRNGSLSVTREFIDMTLKARDHVLSLLNHEDGLPSALQATGEQLLARIRRFAGIEVPGTAEAPGAGESQAPSAAGARSERGTARTYRIHFKPSADIFRNGTKVLNLLEELGGLGTTDAFPHTEQIPSLDLLDPESCYCFWDVMLTTERDINAIRDVFIFVEGDSELRIEELPPELVSDAEGKPRKLGEILMERGEVSPDALREALKSQKRLGEVLVEKHIVTQPQIEAALVEQEHLKRTQERAEGQMGSIRVASDKLDALVDLVGELVTLQARLSQISLDLEDGSLGSISEQFERLIAQLRDNTMVIRMLPIGSTFNKFRRVVRDLSTELGKEAELLTEGAETELDKTVIERLGDPLVHIIRNSIDHGIETPDRRAKAGKPAKGTIKLAARHSGAYVLIQVSDDGAGLDREAIRAKAVERGLLVPSQELPDQELFQLIFAPGFSTARKVTTVSGRGVGMDVVKREIESLGGSVQLNSAAGAGMTVTLKIPLTLAIIDGLLIRIGTEFYVIPLSSVDGCIEIGREDLSSRGERRIIHYREELVPYIKLREAFESGGDEPDIEQIVIAAGQDARVGFVVDQVVGDYQTVIKPLGRMYRDVEGISGATILGDGTVALILDVNRLAGIAQRDAAQRVTEGV
ncbi:MAG TPA: chemotaxis protein CheA [Rectinemataceae bacterium]|nr:chemotaxis protein CheA [Rectinemataceae bacterium]